jgi:hypothetical protein
MRTSWSGFWTDSKASRSEPCHHCGRRDRVRPKSIKGGGTPVPSPTFVTFVVWISSTREQSAVSAPRQLYISGGPYDGVRWAEPF